MDLLAIHNAPQAVAARTAVIRATILRESPNITQPNFERIAAPDLARLVELYDRDFFGGWLAQGVQAQASIPLLLRLSATMTRSGGKTTRFRRRRPGGEARTWFEIAVASRMLSMTFKDDRRPIVVCGRPCADRLQALQCIMEHEIIHLAEMLAWGRSSCSGPRFRHLAKRIFGHTDKHHALVTPREHAAVQHGVRVGTPVEFEFEGRRYAGRVNRVHKRATVLVEDDRGVPYTDGKRYAKFYIPLGQLRAQPMP